MISHLQPIKQTIITPLIAAGVVTLLAACASNTKAMPSVVDYIALPSIGTVQSRNQFVMCVECDAAPTPKTLAVPNVLTASEASNLANAQKYLAPETTPVISPVGSLRGVTQVFEHGVHPTDLLIQFERGSSAVPESALSAISNLRPAMSVPHILHLVASTDGVGSKRINRALADARAQAVSEILNRQFSGEGFDLAKRKQLKLTTAPATSRGINPDARTVLIQIEVL